FVPEDLRFDLAHDSRTARLQDAMGAIAWPLLEARRAANLDGDAAGGTTVDGSSRGSGSGGAAGSGSGDRVADRVSVPAPLLITPPQDWSAGKEDAGRLLSLLQSAYQHGLAAPRPLTAAVSAARGAQVPPAALTDPNPGDGIADSSDPGSSGSASGSGNGTGVDGSGPGDGTGASDGTDLGFTWNQDGRVSPSLVDRLAGQLARLQTLGGM